MCIWLFFFLYHCFFFFFFQAEDGIRDLTVTGVQTCALPIFSFTARVSGDWKCARGIVAGSRCGCARAAARGTATCEWMSKVRLFGRISRPGRSRRRAAVASYLFQTSAMWSVSRWGLRGAPRYRDIRSGSSGSPQPARGWACRLPPRAPSAGLFGWAPDLIVTLAAPGPLQRFLLWRWGPIKPIV